MTYIARDTITYQATFRRNGVIVGRETYTVQGRDCRDRVSEVRRRGDATAKSLAGVKGDSGSVTWSFIVSS